MKKFCWMPFVLVALLVSVGWGQTQREFSTDHHDHFDKFDSRERPDTLKEPYINGPVEKIGIFYLVQVANAKPNQGSQYYHEKLRAHAGEQLTLRNYKSVLKKEKGDDIGRSYQTGEIVTKSGELLVWLEECQFLHGIIKSTVTKNGWVLWDEIWDEKQREEEDIILTAAQNRGIQPRFPHNSPYNRIPEADRKKWVGKKVIVLDVGFGKRRIVLDETGMEIKTDVFQPLAWKRWGLPEPDFRQGRYPGKPVPVEKPKIDPKTKVA